MAFTVTWRERAATAVYSDANSVLARLLDSPDKESLDFTEPFSFGILSTPLCWALLARSFHVVKQLLEAGASVNYGENANKPLFIACVCSQNPDICRLLLRHGADVHGKDDNGYQALYYAALSVVNGNSEIGLQIITLLLECGAQVYNPSESWEAFKKSPFVAALQMGHIKIVALFLDHCRKEGYILPLEWLFDTALSTEHRNVPCEKSAIFVLQRGYFPVQNKTKKNASYFKLAADHKYFRLMCLLIEC